MARKLSMKRSMNALLFGEATAKDLINKYLSDPTSFPNGLHSIPRIAAEIADQCLWGKCRWQVSEAERQLASGRANSEVVRYIKLMMVHNAHELKIADYPEWFDKSNLGTSKDYFE